MTGNNNDTGGPIDEKSNQWFGASVSSSGEDGVIVVSDGICFCFKTMLAESDRAHCPSQCKCRVADAQIIAKLREIYFLNFLRYFTIFIKFILSPGRLIEARSNIKVQPWHC